MIQLLYAMIGCIIGAYVASIGMAAIERLYRRSLGRPKDGPQWVCRLCKHKLGFLDTIPVLSFMATSGRCKYCGSEIPFGLLSTELVGGMCGCAIGLLIYQSGFTLLNLAAIYVCLALLFCSLQEMSFGKLYWVTVICIALGAIFASFQARRVLISIAFLIVWLMVWEGFRMYKQAELKKLRDGMKTSQSKSDSEALFDTLSKKLTSDTLVQLGVLDSTLDNLSNAMNQQIYYWMFNPYMVFGLIVFNIFGLIGAVSIVLFANVIGAGFVMWKRKVDFDGVGYQLKHAKNFVSMPQIADSAFDKSGPDKKVRDSNNISNIWSRKQSSPSIIYIAMVVYLLYISSLLFNFM